MSVSNWMERRSQTLPGWRLPIILVLLALVVRGNSLLEPVLAATGSQQFNDSDGDGLSDAFEAYLSTASTDPALAANPYDADSDGDGQPDGFEYCLSSRQEVNSPGVVQSVVPQITLGSHQVGDQLILTLYIIPGDLELLEDFVLLAAAPMPSGEPKVINATAILEQNIQSVSFVHYRHFSMAVLRASAPISVLGAYSSIAFAALGKTVGVKTGDSATFTVHQGLAYRWTYKSVAAPGSDPGGDDTEGEAEPQSTDGEPGAQPEKVCKTTDIKDPGQTPGVLTTIPTGASCDGGTWTCSTDLCTPGGPAAQPKVVLDHLSLLQ